MKRDTRGGAPQRPAHLRRQAAAPVVVVVGGGKKSGHKEAPSSSSSSASASAFLAALALVAGTAVGGGCLAIPASTAECGFLPASVTLVVVWGVLCVNGLLMVEVAVALHQRTGRTAVPMQVLAETTLGRRWGRILAACYALVRREEGMLDVCVRL